MRIIDVQTIVVGTPWRELVFVELKTDDGLVGVGEVRPFNKTETVLARIRELALRYVIGADPFNVELLGWHVVTGEYGRPGEVGQTALAALDIACWDLVGQALGVPIWKLLGGCFRDRVLAYANGWYQSDRDPTKIASLARNVVQRGYRAMKLDPFGAAREQLSPAERRLSMGIVAAVREAVGPEVELMIEMHGRFTPAAAADLAARLEPFEPTWIEEPISADNWSGLQIVRNASRIPIALGERLHSLSEFRPFIEGGFVDIIQADLTHFGGFLQMKRLAGWAEAYDLTLAPHNVCGPVGTAANLHFAIATRNYKILEYFNDFADPWLQELVDEPFTIDGKDGHFELPLRSGLGVRLNHEACRRHPRTYARIRLFEPGWEQRLAGAPETAHVDGNRL